MTSKRLLTEKEKHGVDTFRSLEMEIGRSALKNAWSAFCAEKLNTEGREERKQFRWPRDYKGPYARQRGICGHCGVQMAFIRGELDIDHINPLAEDFNGEGNLSVKHKSCNRSKGCRDISQLARDAHMTTLEYIKAHPEFQE